MIGSLSPQSLMLLLYHVILFFTTTQFFRYCVAFLVANGVILLCIRCEMLLRRNYSSIHVQ